MTIGLGAGPVWLAPSALPVLCPVFSSNCVLSVLPVAAVRPAFALPAVGFPPGGGGRRPARSLIFSLVGSLARKALTRSDTRRAASAGNTESVLGAAALLVLPTGCAGSRLGTIAETG